MKFKIVSTFIFINTRFINIFGNYFLEFYKMETTANINEETECLSKDRQNNISKIQTLWRNNSYFPTLVLILICIGLTGYSLFGSTVDILSNPLFKLCVSCF